MLNLTKVKGDTDMNIEDRKKVLDYYPGIFGHVKGVDRDRLLNKEALWHVDFVTFIGVVDLCNSLFGCCSFIYDQSWGNCASFFFSSGFMLDFFFYEGSQSEVCIYIYIPLSMQMKMPRKLQSIWS